MTIATVLAAGLLPVIPQPTQWMPAKLHQTAHNLKAMNLSTEQIVAATGLSAAEIAAL